MNPLLQKLTDIKNEKDQYLVPENVRKDVEVLGITGTLEELDTSDATATASDIADGKTAYVNNQKVTGNIPTYSNGEKKYLTKTWASLADSGQNVISFLKTISKQDVCYLKEYSTLELNFRYTDLQIINLSPENIKSGVTILGVTGSVVELQGQTKTVTPTAEQQVITPDQGYNGLTQVTVEAVEDLTPQIQAQEQIIAQLQEEVASKSTEAPTLELYDVLDLQHTCVASYDTDYIPNENTEIFVEYEDWYNYVSPQNTVNLFGVRYGTRQGRATSSTWTNACGFGSYNYGNFKFGDKELRTSTSNKLTDIEGKIRLKLNKNGIYKYNYNTSQYETIALFDSTPTIDTMQHTIALFEEKQIMTIINPQETYINHNNGNSQTLKFYFMEIYENGVLKAKYVPAKYGNEIGVYDTVAQKMLDRITPLDVYNEVNN